MRDLPGMSGPMCDWPTVEVTEGALDTLGKLASGAVCCLASNARDSQPEQIRRALQRAGLDSCIREIFCYRSLGVEKPSAEFYQAALQQLNLRGEEVVMVGDDLNSDVLGASAAGLLAVWYNPQGLRAPEPVLEVRSLTQLTTLFDTPA